MPIILMWGAAGLLITVLTAHSYGEEKNLYSSASDALLTVHKLGILPASDNVQGVYARTVDEKLKELVGAGHRFDLKELKDVESGHLLSDYENNDQAVRSLGSKFKTDGFVSAYINKASPNSLELTLDFFLAKDGLLLVQETAKIENSFNASKVSEMTIDLYRKLIQKIPYQGLILSREGNRVTIDVGAQDGVIKNSIVTVEQIFVLQRHPKFHFAVGFEKITLGKIKLVKVEDTLSFGMIISEKERGVIAVDSKVSGLDFVNYASSDPNPLTPGEGGSGNFDSTSKFSKGNGDLLPTESPSFGKVGLALAVGSFRSALSFQNSGSYEAYSSLYPQVQISGEIWITPEWFAGTEIRQGTTSSLTSSTSNVSGGVTTTAYDLYAGYKILLQDDFWGPQVNLRLGFGSNATNFDQASSGSISTTGYGGLYYGIGGSLPVVSDRSIYADLEFNRYFSPQFSESPYASGAANDSSAMQISLGGSYKFSQHLRGVAHLVYEFYSTTFSGAGTRNFQGSPDLGLNSSQSMTSFITGINYFF